MPYYSISDGSYAYGVRNPRTYFATCFKGEITNEIVQILRPLAVIIEKPIERFDCCKTVEAVACTLVFVYLNT